MTRPSSLFRWLLTVGILLTVPIGWGADDLSTILIVRKNQPQFTTVKDTITGILNDHRIVDRIITKDTTYEDFTTLVREAKPAVILVMDNPAISFAKQLPSEPDELAKLPVVATMGINLKQNLAGVPTMSGVTYEVPPFSIITGFQKLTAKKLKRVVVFHRPAFSQLIEDATRQLQRVGIELVAIDVTVNGSSQESIDRFINANARRICDEAQYDAVLLLPDNYILSNRSIRKWQGIALLSRKPFLCGLPDLVENRARFCTYASYPNLEELGTQVGEMLNDIAHGEVTPADLGVEYLISFDHKIDLGLCRRLRLRVDLESIEADRVIVER